MVNFVEQPAQIGRGEGLSAVLTRPTELDPTRPVFVILNAGLLHRVGPFRLHVTLARRLAQQGFPALRVDLSGLGYSPRDRDRQGVEAALADADTVFEWLRETCALTRPVLLGSCSGADFAHRIAVADERVHGCVFLDGYAYHNARSRLDYYSTRVHRPEMWSKWLHSHLVRAPEEASTENGFAAEDDEEFWDSEFPPLEQFRTDLQLLLARGLSLLYVYSGSVREYRYEDQFFDVCPEAREGRVSVRYYPRADHTYMFERDRLALLDAVCAWAENGRASAEPAGA